jgi:DNA repair protein RecO (recombination protein O)
MSARVSEAYVLQTWPFKEGDLIVSFLARDYGKLRGVARRARRPKSGFGSGLERLSHVRMSYFHRENRELVTIDSCEILHSQFGLVNDFAAACALDFFAEVSEQLLPAAEPNEKYFRLITAVLDDLRNGNGSSAQAGPGAERHGQLIRDNVSHTATPVGRYVVRDKHSSAQAEGSVVRDKQTWRAVTYFSVWAVKLAGLLPELHVCLGCGTWLDDPEKPERAWFARGRAGLHCHDCRRALDIRSAWELSSESRAIAEQILHTPIGQLPARVWTQSTAADLRRFLAQQMEAQIERKLITFPVLEAAA